MAYFEYKNKNIYYEENGNGEPLVFLHGNTASSKMFESIIKLYLDKYRVVTIDFLGHGKSQRLEEFPLELWYDEAMQTIALLEFLSLENVNLLGTSGGAWVALNVALERPDLVKKVVADSFDGRTLARDFAVNLLEERCYSKQNEIAKQFYVFCHGNDWESVVDNDTNCLLQFAKEHCPLIKKELSELKVPLLLTASKTDDMIRNDFEDEYTSILEIVQYGEKCVFLNGFHPAVISNDIEYSKIIKNFLK
ncbi:pimeloyl-ACP methyl ester carboxylesterase [Sedimentibacter acidaminivorans]|uniref:Pimeloyl-ACP methyl ester carboxylesterase n=1 Tax=Sedimentibacter acidaminivorans TaxID=913099 RepID=A0ABS4GDK2_9FIRM|nr:alpha/beta hydrolase [Sedimentibacter acidaminivorans]MBP1925587.1 pimeloyl-ACP methyl ester carboxylesterase [Sedimentibacter acidaminivorans]